MLFRQVAVCFQARNDVSARSAVIASARPTEPWMRLLFASEPGFHELRTLLHHEEKNADERDVGVTIGSRHFSDLDQPRNRQEAPR